MAHGYLGDGYGIHGESDDRDDRREHGSRDDWRRDERWRDRDRGRGMMFGDRERSESDYDRFDSHGREFGRGNRDFASSRDLGDGRRNFSAHPDDHYRSWRDRHMSELDRDYQEYCREREQAFHQDFDAWRSQRHANYQPLRTGMTQSGISHDPEGGVQVATEGLGDETNGDPMGNATLGTNSTSSSRRGRG